MARRRGDVLELRSGNLTTHSSTKQWRSLEADGIKVRPRALTNTLFARLMLCDLFVHGIGGGLYDELTDELLRRFYHVEPPGYLVLSATLRLPLTSHSAAESEERRLARMRRDLDWNPARHVERRAVTLEEESLLLDHASLASDEPATRAERRERFRRVRAVLSRLRPLVADRVAQVNGELELTRRRVAANAVIRRRDYSLCLYPEAMLRSFCTRFLMPA
jgi:hypothetical protein